VAFFAKRAEKACCCGRGGVEIVVGVEGSVARYGGLYLTNRSGEVNRMSRAEAEYESQ
jgi:hypothetical protein